MKKYIIIAFAALAASVACTKVDTVDVQKEISFEVANRLSTKAFAGTVYSNGAFGTYAWFNGANDFMVNEQVDLIGGVWKTKDHTFYWPKTGSIDFISYSPFAGTSNTTTGTVPVVTKTTIDYNDVAIANTDLMYADKVNCSENINDVTDDATPESGFTGVPTVFHHALAKLSVKMAATFLTYTDPTTNTTTDWEVIVNSAKISGLYNEGSCALAWDAINTQWTKPAGNVWTPSASASVVAEQELIASPLTLRTTPQDLTALTNAFVMPQALTDGQQKIVFDITINTTLSNGLTITENYTPTVDLNTAIAAIEMNQNVVYTINIKPTLSVDPNNLDNPTDVTITFDPAVDDWVNVSAASTVNL